MPAGSQRSLVDWEADDPGQWGKGEVYNKYIIYNDNYGLLLFNSYP